MNDIVFTLPGRVIYFLMEIKLGVKSMEVCNLLKNCKIICCFYSFKYKTFSKEFWDNSERYISIFHEIKGYIEGASYLLKLVFPIGDTHNQRRH